MADITNETITIPSPAACWMVAENSGWHAPPASFGEDIALIHSELSEALEAYRGTLPPETEKHLDINFPEGRPEDGRLYDEFKANLTKKCIAEELADVMIRVCHLAAKQNINLEKVVKDKHERNKTRPYRHGNKLL